jgi:SAM-dependent methyltransferase
MLNFKDFWTNNDNPEHAYYSGYWFSRYIEDIRYFIKDQHAIAVDAGCSNGEVLFHFTPHFKKVYGIDYSERAIQKAKKDFSLKNVSNVEFICSDIVLIDECVPEKVDLIFNNSVMQFLNPEAFNRFLQNCKKVLKPKGEIVLLNIPNINCRDLFINEFYKQKDKISFNSVILKSLRTRFYLFRKKITNPGYRFEDGIGYWYSFADIERMAASNALKVEFYLPQIPHYGYRFHIRLTSIDQNSAS